jgi:CO/xanthine dehydrogenase Mo-binding subunit
LRIGVKKSGEITALDMNCLMNTGAYGSHALTVLSNAGSKVLPLFNKIPHVRFNGMSAYTNLPVGGAYRGYGATQSYFALNCEIDRITRQYDLDILEFYKKWHIREGETSPIFAQLGEGKEGVEQFIKSCKLDECVDIGAKAIDWNNKRGKKLSEDGVHVRGVGSMIAMQGSGIPRVDMGSASMKMNEDGSFNLYIGATDLGTGSDTVLAQIAAEVLNIPVEKILVLSSDTDLTPFDVGAYASSTTYVSGKAVEKCAAKILEQVKDVAAEMLGADKDDLEPEAEKIRDKNSGKSVGFDEICVYSLYTNNQYQIQASASNFPVESPPPFIAQFAEVEVNIRTGEVKVLEFVSAVDCGMALHPKLAEGQVEGAAINGISYALTEEYLFDKNGRMINSAFSHYKLFTGADLPVMKTFLVDSWEETGPYGAKSVGEIAMNGALPAIANAIYDAAGVRLNKAPFTQDRVWKALKEAGKNAD